TVFSGGSAIGKRPDHRWKECEDRVHPYLDAENLFGAFIGKLSIEIGEFHIPPDGIADILPQHLLMMKVSACAMEDANLQFQKVRPRMGAVIGMDFDFETTNFHLRWNLFNNFSFLKRNLNIDANDPEMTGWQNVLQDALSPKLTHERTLGALGGIIASRVAREFRLGGPCFTVSGDETSGIKALEIGVRSLQQNETDLFLIGAVDLAGDIRKVLAESKRRSLTHSGEVRPFDRLSDGTLPGEGAAAIVIKRFDEALNDGDRIYAVIKGIGSASGGGIDSDSISKDAYIRSMKSALDEAGISSEQIGFIETHGSGDPVEDALETEALHEVFMNDTRKQKRVWAVGSLKPTVGHTGACAGLASVVKTSLCLFHHKMPPFRNFVSSQNDLWEKGLFWGPASAQSWPGNNKGQTPKACVCSMTTDGNASHVVMEGVKNDVKGRLLKTGQGNRHKRSGQSTLKFKEIKRFSSAEQTRDIGDFKGQTNSITIPVGGNPPSFSILKSFRQQSPYRNFHSENGPPVTSMIAMASQNAKLISDIHCSFLSFSRELTKAFGHALSFHENLLENLPGKRQFLSHSSNPELKTLIASSNTLDPPVFSRKMCMEFAVGSVAKVLGPEFEIVDTYLSRVRLPDEPLMLVDRIVSMKGEKCSMGTGQIVTEHDVTIDAWYLDGGSAPVSISMEAGQADLFLCAYLGIDHAVRGTRNYRLLDAAVTFHRHLPRPGETIRYEIDSERFVRHGDTYLFFFRYNAFIGKTRFITMRNGCAGFFTKKELKNSGGIILSQKDRSKANGKRDPDWKELVPLKVESYDDSAIEALRQGDISACFGQHFKGIVISDALKLPGGRMKLIDRILKLDPTGGRFNLGLIQAEADIHFDDWFLTCHFVDDKVMPGTLMYECCSHTLRIFILRIGWITDRSDVDYGPVID
ncbi:MAG: beta-ketoacyl synthase N-terminal-like domain-containing protein, partial [Desulfobacterales bacterium]